MPAVAHATLIQHVVRQQWWSHGWALVYVCEVIDYVWRLWHGACLLHISLAFWEASDLFTVFVKKKSLNSFNHRRMVTLYNTGALICIKQCIINAQIIIELMYDYEELNHLLLINASAIIWHFIILIDYVINKLWKCQMRHNVLIS